MSDVLELIKFLNTMPPAQAQWERASKAELKTVTDAYQVQEGQIQAVQGQLQTLRMQTADTSAAVDQLYAAHNSLTLTASVYMGISGFLLVILCLAVVLLSWGVRRMGGQMRAMQMDLNAAGVVPPRVME